VVLAVVVVKGFDGDDGGFVKMWMLPYTLVVAVSGDGKVLR
jgi:hypothetical protein